MSELSTTAEQPTHHAAIVLHNQRQAETQDSDDFNELAKHPAAWERKAKEIISKISERAVKV